ncbi:DUF488 domain-containing protein [Pyxidicoccus xibeiensis]|uniref:DUF488 domain-containing protein n=1 Tax=Pyxidicoccus xibeiensis TaxID=2906759 RepID=UPI0020A79046|nr:DUF488 domain-containing protein [Pyxidicoccus xibeiensis]MCP3143893.1 DUF488 domain-containing protein [Pyxidicoccus xibeiensis]
MTRLHRWSSATVFAVGHSTRPIEELVSLLWAHGVATVVDIRKMPRSRTNPQFNSDALEKTLPTVGIRYLHLANLGGLRKRGAPTSSANAAWRNASFRAYADYMQTSEFEEGLSELHDQLSHGPPALMCAEALRWRCHRSLVADALVARGAQVLHIESVARATPHRLTAFARISRGRVTYPSDPRTPRQPAVPFSADCR